MKNLLFIAWCVPFATILILGILTGAILIAPFFLVGFLIYQRKKNKRKNDIIALLKDKARAFEA